MQPILCDAMLDFVHHKTNVVACISPSDWRTIDRQEFVHTSLLKDEWLVNVSLAGQVSKPPVRGRCVQSNAVTNWTRSHLLASFSSSHTKC